MFHQLLLSVISTFHRSLIGTGERGAFSLSDNDAVESAVAYLASTCAVASADPICVYGSTLDAYAALEGLRTRGIAPGRLVLVTPPGAKSPFVDPRAAKVEELLAAMRVTVIIAEIMSDHRRDCTQDSPISQVRRNLRLASLEADESRMLTAALFESLADGDDSAPSVTAQPCRVLLCCGDHGNKFAEMMRDHRRDLE